MVLNIIIVLIVLLIGYWWGNQGVFSSLLHLLCVIVAGGIALSFWEPLTGVLVNGGGFDHYAPGVVLVGLFAVSLLILRVAADRLVGANVQAPHWANLVFGGLLGLGSGTIAMGMVLLGVGHMQLPHDLLGYQGFGRLTGSDQRIARIDTMWLPVDKFTSDFYSLLSISSLRSGQPLALYEPDLYKQANLVRDTFGRGKGQVVMPPDGAEVERAIVSPDLNRVGVQVRFKNQSIDFGQQLTLSKAQIRLICFNGKSDSSAEVYYPDQWTVGDKYHLFDDTTHYITSVPGQESADVIVEFPLPPNHATPQFIQIRNVRYALPRLRNVDRDEFLATRFMGVTTGERTTFDFDRARSIDHLIEISDSIRPVNVGVNNMPSGMEVVDRYLVSGKALFGKGLQRPSPNLRVKGLWEPLGTEVVKVDVSRNQPADIFRIRDQVEADATIALIDAEGNEYRPIGYMYRRSDGTEIMLDPDRKISSIAQLPSVPSTGNQKLDLLFYVTEGAELRGLRVGQVALGRCSVVVAKQD